MDELVIDNLVYIPSRKAAEITGYAKDYVGQLCREGRIEAKLVGRSWYVLESSIREHRFGAGEQGSPVRTVIEEPEKVAEPVSTAPDEATASAEEALGEFRAWAPASYTSEPVEELPDSDHPTSLTNTMQKVDESQTEAVKTSQIEEVQNAWQEWFSKNELNTTAPVSSIGAGEQSEEVKITKKEPFSAVEEVMAEEEGSPVRISRSYAGSMDIEPERPARSAPEVREEVGQVVHERVVRKARKGKERATPSLMLKAVFVGIIIITLAITAIGTGSLDAISPSWSKKPGAINFLAGVTVFERE